MDHTVLPADLHTNHGLRADNGSAGRGHGSSWVKWVDKCEWVTWVTGQYRKTSLDPGEV